MSLELKIVWDGDVPGLAEHRLSINEFGNALNLLLSAYQRIASNMIRNAVDYAEVGRLRDPARYLDIEIVSIEQGSSGFTGVCILRPPPPGQQFPLFVTEITERASKEILDAVEEESKGVLRNLSVRKYLSKLPQGLTRQSYTLTDNHNVVKEVIIERLTLPEEAYVELPYLVEFSGNIIGVGFEPGRSEVRIKTETNQTLALLASSSQVDKAIDLRGCIIRGTAVVKDQTKRLLRMERHDSPPFIVTPELEKKYVFDRWDDLLRKLAQ